MSKQRGITLIALIITIIVMLILVAVTISVALNGGLFERGRNASEQTQVQADREALLSAVIGTLDKDGRVVFSDPEDSTKGLDKNLPDGFQIVRGKTGVYKNIKTEKMYKVDKTTGNVEEITDDDGDIDDLIPTQEQLGFANYESMYETYDFDTQGSIGWIVSLASSSEEHISKGFLCMYGPNDEQLYWFSTPEAAALAGSGFEACKWYVLMDSGEIQLYTKTSQLQLSNFTPYGTPGSEQYNSNLAYIERIIDEFNK